MDLEKMMEEYKKCVEICSKIDYLNKKTINENNKAATKMYSTLNNIKNTNKESIQYFYQLLDDELAGKWFSHQLLELFSVDSKVEKKALAIIKKLSKNEPGEKYWLKNYKNKKKQKI
jgi:hypothetical protein